MEIENLDYSAYMDFFEAFSRADIEGIASDDPIRTEMEKIAESNNQVFYISDPILFDILFTSKGVYSWFGIKPEEVSQGFFLTTTIPEDFIRHQLARTHLVDQAHEIYSKKAGIRIVSSNFRANKKDGTCSNLLYQARLFYSDVPYESVFLLLVITDISKFEKIHKNYHFYSGNDLRFFRFPDDELLMTGNLYSYSEYNIIKLIYEGLTSREIAEKLCRSVNTVNTHRTNILMKAGKSKISDVIRDLKDKGLL